MSSSSRSLERVSPGGRLRDAVTSDRLNSLTALARSASAGENIRGGPGVIIRRGPNGITIRTRPVRVPKGGGAAEVGHAWKINKRGGLLVTLNPGTVNGVLPTNWRSEFEIPPDQDAGYFIWLAAVLVPGGFGITNLTYAQGGTLPIVDMEAFDGDSSPGTLVWPLACLFTGETAITEVLQMETRNLNLIRTVSASGCGENKYQMVWYSGEESEL